MSVFIGPNYYRTRDGHKAIVGDSGHGYLTGAILDAFEEGPVAWHWTASGASMPDGEERQSDLIEVWKE